MKKFIYLFLLGVGIIIVASFVTKLELFGSLSFRVGSIIYFIGSIIATIAVFFHNRKNPNQGTAK